MAWLSPKRSKLVHAARRSQILKFRQIWTRSRASAAIDAPHDPASKTQGYPGTDHTQGMPEQPDITRDCSILQNGRVHKVFSVILLGRTTPLTDLISPQILINSRRRCVSCDCTVRHVTHEHGLRSQSHQSHTRLPVISQCISPPPEDLIAWPSHLIRRQVSFTTSHVEVVMA